jgi:tripartite-type tricarboxylate transporter receptor subunit TctC
MRHRNHEPKAEETMSTKRTSRSFGIAPAILIVALAAASEAAQSAQAEFPVRPVRLVNPYTPGGSVDLVGRALAAGLSEIWGQQVIVDNRPGAGTTIGTELVARAEPDGYTMLINSAAIAIMPSIYKNLRFDPVRDLTPVALNAISPFMMVVHPGFPVKSVQDVIELAKKDPGKIPAASSGAGSTNHLTLEMFKAMAKIDLLHVPYKGGNPAIAGLMGGQTKLHFNTPGTLLGHVKAGKLRAIAMTSAKRADFMPDLPTVAESGVPGFEANVWYAVLGPRKIPARIVQRWSEAINQQMKTPQAQEHFRRTYMTGSPNTPADFEAFYKREVERWSAAVKAAGIEAQ